MMKNVLNNCVLYVYSHQKYRFEYFNIVAAKYLSTSSICYNILNSPFYIKNVIYRFIENRVNNKVCGF